MSIIYNLKDRNYCLVKLKPNLSFLLILIISFALVSNSCRLKRRDSRRYLRGVYHVVKKGQTLWRIAKTYKKSINLIVRANRLRDAEELKVGQKIFIPGAKKLLNVKVYIPPRGKPSYSNKIKGRLFWPVKGVLTSKFGVRNYRHHDGIDIGASKGTKIRAAGKGKVIFSDYGPKGYGKIVIIQHSKGFTTIYAHNNKNLVKKGYIVRKGQIIAEVGETGKATGPHLHFEVRIDRIPVNPLKYLH